MKKNCLSPDGYGRMRAAPRDSAKDFVSKDWAKGTGRMVRGCRKKPEEKVHFMKHYEAVLYDIDGTLLDTRDMNLYPLLRIIKEELGQDWTYDQVKKYLAYTGMQVMEELNIRDKETTYARWVRYVNEYPEPAKLFPGLAQALEAIHRAGVLQAIVSSKMHAQFEIDMAGKGILPYFATAVLEEDTVLHKPNPEPLQLCLERLGTAPENAIYIGDMPSDCVAAKRAGMDFALARWGSDQTAEQADLILESPKDLLKLVHGQ